MLLTPSNIGKFYAKLDQFRRTEKYTDVTVRCENRNFKCHKLILSVLSDHFDGIFSRTASDDASIVLEQKPDIFETILEFMYTGNAILTSDNLCDVILATTTLQMGDLQQRCVEFVRKEIPQKALDVFLIACASENQTLMNQLADFIVENVDIFSSMSKFVEMPFEGILATLNQWSSTMKNEETLLISLIRWFRHSPETRSPYFDQVVEILHSKKIKKTSHAYKTFVGKKFSPESNLNSSFRALVELDVDYSEKPSDLRDAIRENEKSLHALIKHPKETSVRIFSVNRAQDCYASGDIPHLLMSNIQEIRCTVSEDHQYLYCLHAHALLENREDDVVRHMFRAYSSLEMRNGLDLMPVPFVSRDYDDAMQICTVPKSGVYLYDSSDKIPIRSPNLKENEIKRNLYLYNCELDNWFAVPKMKKEIAGACMTHDAGVLYLVSGTEGDQWNRTQAYDYREKKWRLLPPQKYLYDAYAGAAAGAHKGKIYVFMGDDYEPKIEVYDPVAGKWDVIESQKQSLPDVSRVVSYANKLWVFARRDLHIIIYEPESNRWTTYSTLRNKAVPKVTVEPSYFLETIVFKRS